MRKPKIVGKYDCTVHPRWFWSYFYPGFHPIQLLNQALHLINSIAIIQGILYLSLTYYHGQRLQQLAEGSFGVLCHSQLSAQCVPFSV